MAIVTNLYSSVEG